MPNPNATKSTFSFWSPAENHILIQNRHNHTYKQLQVLLSNAGFTRSRGAVERRCRRLALAFGGNPNPAPQVGPVVGPVAPVVAQKQVPPQAVQAAPVTDVNWTKIIEMTEQFNDNAIDRSNGFVKATRRIVSLSDIHIPFQRNNILQEAVERAKGCDVLVLNGDIFDCYGISVFKKSKKVPLLMEYAAVLEFVRGLVPHFPHIRLVRGNHEKRFSGTFNTAMKEELEPPLGEDLLERIARGDIYDEAGTRIGNYDFPNVHYDKFSSWYTVVGKTIFCHPRRFSRVPGGTVKMAYDWFQQVGHLEFDSIVMGHTHQIAKYVYEGKMLIEQGCLTSLLEYQWDDGMRYVGQGNGFAEIFQDEDGNTDFNSSRVNYMGSQHAPLPEIVTYE